MDRERIRSLFSNQKSNYSNSSFDGSVQSLNNTVFPNNTNQGDIILSSGESKRKSPIVLIIGLIALLLIVILVVLLYVFNNGNDSITNEDVVNVANDSYVGLSSLQSSFIKGKNGDISSIGFFSEESKSNVNESIVVLRNYYDKLSNINVASISNERSRNSLIKLRDALNDDLEKYQNFVDYYNLLYEYVNNEDNSSVASEIKQIDNPVLLLTFNNLKKTIQETGNYEYGTVSVDLFNAALGDDYPNLYYYELLGDIIAEGESENVNKIKNEDVTKDENED